MVVLFFAIMITMMMMVMMMMMMIKMEGTYSILALSIGDVE